HAGAAGPLRVVGQVVAGAEGLAGAGEHDDVDAGVGVCHRDAIGKLDRQVVVDRVHHFGPVEGDASDSPVLFVNDLRHYTLLGATRPALTGSELRLKGFRATFW